MSEKIGQLPQVSSATSTDFIVANIGGGGTPTSGTDSIMSYANFEAEMAALMDPAFVDYASLSTIVGWSSFTDKMIRYNKVGKFLTVWFVIRGASNSALASFTIPYNAVSATASGGSGTPYAVDTASGINLDNGTIQSTPARVYIDPNASANTVNMVRTSGINGWTNSGTKDIRGTFFVELA